MTRPSGLSHLIYSENKQFSVDSNSKHLVFDGCAFIVFLGKNNSSFVINLMYAC